MATQGGETDEEYADDPIKLIDFEQERVNTLKKLRNNCQTEDVTDSDVDVVSDSVPFSKYKRVCFTLPASFFTISKNVELLNGCPPVAVKIVDCIKHSSYNKKKIRSTDTGSDIIIVDDEIIEESVENVCGSDIEDCVVISDSEKEESDHSLGDQMGKLKIRPVDITSYIRNNKININHSVQRTSETSKPNEKCEKNKGILQNESRIDFKKNIGLVGLRIAQRGNVDDRSKRLVGQKKVERVKPDKTKDCSNVEKQKSNKVDGKDCSNIEKEESHKVDGKTSQSSKPVHDDVNTLKVSSKSKLLESNTTEKSVKQPENNLSTFNVKHSITNKESLPPNNTNSSKVYKETEKFSNVPEEFNITREHDKQKSSKDTPEKRKKNVESNKTKNNKEKECMSKYFKDVWDKDLRLALEPDTIQLKKHNSSLKYFKDKLKIGKRKNREENTKRNPAELDTNNDGKANNKHIEKLQKTIKDREKSKKKDSIVPDNTKKDRTHSKSMPSLLLGEQIATEKSQVEDNFSSKPINKKTSEKFSKTKCMGVKEKFDVQPISNPKNREVVVNEKNQTSCKGSSKLVMNQLATQNKLDKKAARNKKKSVDKSMSTSTVINRIKPGLMHKDETSTSNPTAVTKQVQSDKPLTSANPTATQQTINQNKDHPLNQKQNEDLYNEDRRKSESLAKSLYHLQSLNPNPVGGDLYLKHAVKPQECILSYVNGNQQAPKDPKTHTDSIGDVQKSSNSTGNNTSSATGPMNSQQIPNQPSNKALVPPDQTMPSNSTNDCNKPDVVKRSKNTFDDNNFNMTSSMQDLSGPMNSQQIPDQPSNKGIVRPAQTVSDNSTNDCNKPDAVKKSKNTFDDNNFCMTSSMQDLPQNTSSAIGPMNSQQIPDQPSNIGIVPPAQTVSNNSTNDCKKPDAVKKSDKTFDNNTTNSSIQDMPPNSNLVKEIDTATSIKSEVSIKQENSVSSYLPPINPAQQTASRGRIIEEYGEPIQALVTNRKDNHKGKFVIAPQVNMKTIGNLNTLPHVVIHCAPIYHGAPQNMPPGDQNQFGFYHPPQGKHISNAQSPMSLPVPQISQPLPEMSQSSPKILQHSQQMSPLSSQISQPSRQISRPSQQMPQPLQQMSQSLPEILQHSQQISQPSRQMPPVSRQIPPQTSQQMPQPVSQMSQPSRQKPQTTQKMPQLSRQIPQHSQQVPQMSQTSPEILQHSQQMSQPSQQISRPSRQMPPVSRQIPPQTSQQMPQTLPQMSQPLSQMSQPSRRKPQTSQKMPQLSRQIPQPSQQVPQMSQTSPEILQHSQQMSQPSQQMPQPSQQMPQPSRQMPQSLRKIPQPSQQMPQHLPQMSQTTPEILDHSQQMSQPSALKSQPSRQMPQPSRQMPQPSQQMPQSSQQISRPTPQMSCPPPQMSCPVPQMSLPSTQMWHSSHQISPQFRHFTPKMSHNVQASLWYPPPQMPPPSSQMYHPVLQNSHSQLRMTPPRQRMSPPRQRMSPPRQRMSNYDLRMSYPQTQNFNLCLCEKCHIDYPQMSNLSPQMLHPPSGMLNRHQQMSHLIQCLSNPPPQVLHPLPTSSHTQKPTWNPLQQLSNPQSQISHLPQQMSNPPPQMSNPPEKYENVAQSVSGSTIIGRNNDGVVRKINIIAAHAKGLPSSTEVKSNNEDFAPVESEKEMFEELCKITTLESPMKEDSTSKKDLKRKLPKNDKIGESTANRRPRIGPMLKKLDDAMQNMKTSSEYAWAVHHKGYSPPILPIATFEKTFEILAQANIELFDNGNFGPIKKKTNPILRKRRCLSFDERRDNAKKISIDEYKKRSTGKDDEAIDFVVQRRKVDQTSGQNPDQDLGYDSDTTMKL